MSRSISLCEHCQQDLPRLESACYQCGLPLKTSKASNICGQCIKQAPAVDYTVCLFPYEAPIDYLISQMKFNQQLSHAAILAYLLERRISAIEAEHVMPTAILPVPLHRSRLRKRGFNQSIEISRNIAKEKQLEILLNTAYRTKATNTQTHLTKKQRKQNIKGCFELKTPLNHSHIVIVDDVVTTGSTSNELAQELKKAGVKKVGVWAIARALITK